MKKSPKIIMLIIVLLYAIYSFLLSDFNPLFKNQEFVYLISSLKKTRNVNFKSIEEIYKEIHKTVKEEDAVAKLRLHLFARTDTDFL